MELKIYSPTEEQFITSIEFNHEEIKQELALRLEKYRGLVYTEETIKEAKADRATLNKFKDAIETRRKEIKKACLKPYEDFEAKIKEIVAMIDEPIKAIDEQIKAYEQAKKDVKLAAIKQFFLDNVADLEGLVPFEKIMNTKWLNVAYKETDIQKEITDFLERVRSDLDALNALDTPYLMQLKDFYLKTLDLTATLQEKKRLEEQAARIAEHEARVQQEREAALKAVLQQHEAMRATEEVIKKEQQELITVDFRVQATREQLIALKKFLVDNGIKYGRVPASEPEKERMAM